MKKPVLVLGGGIAGIQASLDLAEMGVPVFLVESSPSIGGRMAQLDKTFPTNDCSACILAPKVTACYNHPLIKTFTLSELKELKGDAPDFTAVIKKKVRFIDEDLCKGCNDCIAKCPVVKKSEFDMGVGSRCAVYKPFAQAVPNKVAIDKKGTSPCKYKCPAHMDAHGYVTLTGQGRYEEALEVVRRTTPFAGVLGRVCLHSCETKCSRRLVDDPVSIAALKRFIADYEIQQGKTPKVEVKAEKRDQKVAVVGSGPAGLNCAYQLALAGYQVTVFEALPVPGGMLKVGIPDYRLDKKVLETEIQIIKDMGVEILCDTPVGKGLTLGDLRAQGFKAFFLAVGAHRDISLGIPGEDAPGVVSGIRFLRALNLNEKPQIGKKVLVIGGGNVAMDAARSALRLGAEVTVVYRRSEQEMPANRWEIQHAREEGVRFEYLTAPNRVVTEGGRAAGLECVKNELGRPDKSGRRSPVPVPGSDFILEADTIIAAIGQGTDPAPMTDAGIDSFDKNGRLICNAESLKTGVPDVFAGGDAVTGPRTMIEAIAQGNMAAKSIRNFLEGTDLPVEPFLLPETPVEEIDFSGVTEDARADTPMLDMSERTSTFREVESGFSEEQAKREALRCVDCSVCCECRMCEGACTSNAICHEQQPDETVLLPVSSVIFASGYDPSCDIPDSYGYGRYRDVVTSLEYERILSASGPYQGHVQRLSDGKAPERIAFIQCVGSRDEKCGSGYCSAVCCMYAVKEAMITKEHLPSVRDIDIFYMDMRAYGKDFDKYIESARDKYGIGFIRSRASDVGLNGDTGRLAVNYVNENGDAASLEYDMVVLSVGLSPKKGMKNLFHKIGVKTDRYGFCWVGETGSPATSREGILACGAASGPKDIPETVIEASAAASEASRVAGKAVVDREDYIKFFPEEEEVPPRDVSTEPVRIGVFPCHCGVNIGGYLNIKAVVEYAKTLPHVVHAEEFLYTCSVDSQKVIAERIKEYNLNRVVVASCTPRTHEPLFQGVLKKAGLNPYLFNMANIRDQCSWVHMNFPDEGTEKAKDLIRMAVGKATDARQLNRRKIDVTKSALIVGGGVAGMTAALEIARMGYRAYLIEKTGSLGGNAAKINSLFTGRPADTHLEKLIDEVRNDSLIQVFLNAEIKSIDGYVGKYSTVISTEAGGATVNHGVVIVAAGAGEKKPAEYLYGTDNRVLTQMELEDTLRNGGKGYSGGRNVFMIQCVGSRCAEKPYCSRVCCNQAIKNALIMKEADPDINITILYRDIRSYGQNEANYREARLAGIQFVRYEPDKKPEVANEGGNLSVRYFDPVLNADITSEADLIVLASAIEPNAGENRKIAQMLKVPLNEDGFFLEAHAKLRPVDFATDGVFVCGLAHAPKTIKESIVQGKAAAARAATVISKDVLETEGTVAQVIDANCTGCGTCEKVCAYKAISMEDVKIRDGVVKKAMVNAVLCKGCGTCSSACRCGAIDVNGFSDRQVLNEVEYLLRM